MKFPTEMSAFVELLVKLRYDFYNRLIVLHLNLRSVFFSHRIHTMSSVAKYMSKASDENVRNLKVTVETFGFHLVGRPTAA